MSLLRNAFLSASFITLSAAAAAQAGPRAPMTDHGVPVDGKPLASPAAAARTSLNGKSVVITYNAPSMRGRKIFGDLVPYGKVWRTGANPATTLVTETALKLGKLTLPAGTYTLYTLPAAPGKPWQLIVNKQTGQWGTVYKEDMDFGRTPMTHKKLASPQEVMSISFDDTKTAATTLHIRWENTDESVKVEAQ